MVTSKFDHTIAAIELNAARKLNWDYNQFKDSFSFTVNNEAIEIAPKKNILTESEVQTLKEALLDYGFQYKKTINDFIFVFEQDTHST
ncbi:hypothetical protein [Nostoc sp. UHCC 0870]|jgi:hypothetical protein|uniref:hypothetical protein n=1 Tax=Nostoc sp. UHCC 0870 TaxID=2914041 RepID=UPI001EDE35D6|nr:hypothetical protein [Nostoc sp. UHCC 0870]UKO97695.1 hypothetical protein L6494_24500 [Nostoc sp. UHCC 0870]